MRYVSFLWLLLPCFAVAQTEADGLTLLYQADTLVADSLGAAFGPEAQEAEVFFVGEEHFFDENYEVQFAYLVHLYQNYGVEQIAVEANVCDEFAYNQYILYGDSSYIKYTSYANALILNDYKVYPFYWLDRLKAFNDTNSRKVRIRCIDYNYKHSEGISMLARALSHQSHLSVEAVAEDLRKLFQDEENNQAALSEAMIRQKFCEYVRGKIGSSPAPQELLARMLDSIVDSWIKRPDRGDISVHTTGFMQRRESYMYRSLSAIIQSGKTLCWIGAAHLHSKGSEIEKLGSMLESDKVKMHKSWIFYHNPRITNPFLDDSEAEVRGGYSCENPLILDKNEFELYEQVASNIASKYTLFSTDGCSLYERNVRLLILIEKPYKR